MNEQAGRESGGRRRPKVLKEELPNCDREAADSMRDAEAWLPVSASERDRVGRCMNDPRYRWQAP